MSGQHTEGPLDLSVSDLQRRYKLGYGGAILLRADLAEMKAEIERLKERVPSFSPDEYRCTINGARWCPEAELEDLKGQRDELLEALEWYASEDRYHYGKGDVDESEAEMDEGRRARAAIAKATAAKEAK